MDTSRIPSRSDLIRHTIDGAAPIVGFVVGNQLDGVRAGALLAIGLAVVVSVVRRLRGEPLRTVIGITVIVCLLSLTATATGDGRDFFLPELVLNVVALVVFVLSLLVGRPLTAVICSALGLEEPRSWADPARRTVHLKLTAAWIVMWAAHVVVIGYLYLQDSVVGLGAASTVFNKPTLVAMAIVTGIVARRGSSRPPQDSVESVPGQPPAT
jgi:hypothetical protein